MTERKCGLCREAGHTRRTCPYAAEVKAEAEKVAVSVAERADAALERLKARAEEPLVTTKGPWFYASFPGLCDECLAPFESGDVIRANGEGGYECELHGDTPPADDAIAEQTTPQPIETYYTLYCGTHGSDYPCGSRQQHAYMHCSLNAEERASIHAGDVPPWCYSTADENAPGARKHPTAAHDDAVPVTEAEAAEHVHSYRYEDDNRGNSGSFCECGEEEPDAPPVDDAEAFLSMPDTAGETSQDAAMDFLMSEPETEVPARKQTNQRGYLLKDPTTGGFRRNKSGTIKAITRTTTFNKAASDRTALNDWGKRNVLVGASRRPDLVLKAHGLANGTDNHTLDALVEGLEEAAGGKVSASIGSAVHDYSEKLDRDGMKFAEAPAAYRPHLMSYRAALEAAGFKVVGSLIEGTVFIEEFGGVAGKFDRILYHVASGTYVMGDLKTGKNMTYGWDEIESQEAIYTRGYNRFGTYIWGEAEDGSEDRWEAPEFQVRTDVGVVMWLPVQEPSKPYPAGFTDANPPLAGVCYLLKTDLSRGWDHAEMCGAVREQRALKGKPGPWDGIVRSWEEWRGLFAAVTSAGQAGGLWREAKREGVTPAELTVLVEIGQTALRSHGVPS